MSDAPERIGLVRDGFGLYALAHKDEADVATHYVRADLAAVVKPLVWSADQSHIPLHAETANTPFGRWSIVTDFIGMNKAIYRIHSNDYPTIEAAKAAAQADYTARILSALDPTRAHPVAVARAALEAAAKVSDFYDAKRIRAIDPAAIVASVNEKPRRD